jgi:hypothetical protein
MDKKLPDIYYFNPTCEYAVANGHVSWQPNRLLKKMEEDLEKLPLFLAGQEDIIIVKRRPSDRYLSLLEKTGIKAPEFVLLSDAINGNCFQNRRLGRLLPWGWSPAVHRLLETVKTYCSEKFHNSPVSVWNPSVRDLYSKKFALEILKKILPSLPDEIVIQPEYFPEICTKREKIEDLLVRWEKLMIKAPWSTSGRGLQPITKTPVVEKVWEKISGMIREQGFVITEPYLDKRLDVALQFELKQGKVNYLGISRFFTDKKGKYLGNMINGWSDSYDPFITYFADSLPSLLKKHLSVAIENSELANLYEGFLGVDTLIFNDHKGLLRVNPCLEINIRQNMGLLSLKLEKLVHENSKGTFNIWYHGNKPFKNFSEEMSNLYPLKTADNYIFSGFLPVTDPDENSLFGAYLHIL